MRPLHFIPILLLFLSCAYQLPEQPQDDIPDIIIHDYTYYRWFRDSSLNDFITPKEWGDDTGMVIIHVGTPDYKDTEFPDTFWGVYYSTVFPDETLSCVKCDCEKINDTVMYDMFWYFDSLGIIF